MRLEYVIKGRLITTEMTRNGAKSNLANGVWLVEYNPSAWKIA